MKTIIVGSLIGLGNAEAILARSSRDVDYANDAPTDQTRRYWQLTRMMDYFNPTFDERQYWTYGCNCLMLGDRPMSDPGLGPPVDALDTVCKKYKDCLKCARETHGEACIGEFEKYNFNINKFERGMGMCHDTPGSCKRHLCECDAMFAAEHESKSHVFNRDYHIFWSQLPNGWEPRDNCPSGGGGPSSPQCCVSPAGPATIYNAMSHGCNAADGSVFKL